MKKSIIKKIQSFLPDLFNRDGEPIPKIKIANKILDSLPYPDRLGLIPFETWIPLQCSKCVYNDGKKQCNYNLFNENYHKDNPRPEDCPLEY